MTVLTNGAAVSASPKQQLPSRSARWHPTPRQYPRIPKARLRLSPTAWAKLRHWRDAGPTEIGGLGITSLTDPLCVDDVALIKQCCTSASVVFADEALADWFETQVDLGRKPAEFARIWIHTHPGASAEPSSIDEATFQRVFGLCDWAVMLILARRGATYARLQFRIGGRGSALAMRLPVRIDWQRPLLAGDPALWQAEYAACVQNMDAVFGPTRLADVPESGWQLPDAELLSLVPPDGF